MANVARWCLAVAWAAGMAGCGMAPANVAPSAAHSVANTANAAGAANPANVAKASHAASHEAANVDDPPPQDCEFPFGCITEEGAGPCIFVCSIDECYDGVPMVTC